MTSIGIFLFDGAEELDWAGPWEVLAFWATQWPDEAHTFTFARNAGPVTCAKGLRVLPDHDLASMPDMDVLVYPGGRGTRPQLSNDAIKSWVRQTEESGVLMTSVCTGSLVYAAAGLLDDRPATTHWASTDLLRSLGNNIDVRDDRFVDDGNVVTAAGVSAGIDMALHLVARLQSPDRAREVRRGIQYDPEPPV
ncbi:MAG TPA: DJ-1/PfpI family protein [Actinomycetota bacterium]|nr:DJ-1/PfpI family protein [Actinomycetota bacterium]